MKTERLQKIVNMAKNGTDKEKENAILIIKNICKKYNLVFDEIMEKDLREDREFYYSGIVPLGLIAQIYFMTVGYAENNVSHNSSYIFFKATNEQFVEFGNSVDVFRKLYRKQRREMNKRHKDESRLFADAFIQRHHIFSDDTKLTEEQLEKKERAKKTEKLTDEEIVKMQREAEIINKTAREMNDDVVLQKRLN